MSKQLSISFTNNIPRRTHAMKRQVLILVLIFIETSSAESVECETTPFVDWGKVGNCKTCTMKDATSISTSEVEIESDDTSITAINFQYNKKILFLPINVSEVFPNTLGYSAHDCSLTTISRENFRALDKLLGLYLYRNQIQTISSDTFKDLTSMKWLNLHGNRIVQMNGEAFLGLPKLIEVSLKKNQCIHQDFSETEIAGMFASVSEKCRYEEISGKVLDFVNITAAADEKNFEDVKTMMKVIYEEIVEIKQKLSELETRLDGSVCEGDSEKENEIKKLRKKIDRMGES